MNLLSNFDKQHIFKNLKKTIQGAI